MKRNLILFVGMVVLMATFLFSVVSGFLWIPLPSLTQPIIVYSNHLNTPLRHLVMRALKGAASSITLHTYALTDEAVIETLLTKKNAFIDVEVITDAKTTPSIFPLVQEPLKWKKVKSSGLMHEKILVLDGTTVFLGTANMTYESLSMHDNLMIGFHNQKLANYLTEYTQEIDQKKKQKNNTHHTFSIGNQLLELWLLPYKGNAPIERLKELIQNASHSIYIAMFTLTHEEILRELSIAHHKGIAIKVFLDNTSANGASAKALHTLLQEGIPVYLSNGLQLLHHKMMFIDNTCFVLGSANWTKAAFKKNHDFYITLSPLHPQQTKTLQTIFKKITQESTLSTL